MNPTIQEIPILYQDEQFVIVHKPSGILVHPWKGGSSRNSPRESTLMELVKEQTGKYLYPLHRLDRPVSGVVIFALDKSSTKYLKEIWSSDEVLKEYITLCRGHLEDSGVFNFALKDDKKKNLWKEAYTAYHPLCTFPYPKCTLLKVQIKTGRKHQIRRHFSRRMFNLVCDTKYGKGAENMIFREEYDLQRIFLHAYRMKFPHPVKNEIVDIVCPLPEELSGPIGKMGLSDLNLFIEKS